MTKYALIIGITYTGTKLALKGVKNDVISVMNLVSSWGFNKANVTVLFDEKILGTDTILPKHFNIITHLNKFCSKLKADDEAIIYYSGHGVLSQSKMSKIRESSISPMDYAKSGHIDSETIRYYLNKVEKNVNLLCIYDCCNSGSICNLKYHTFDTSYRKDITIKLRHFNEENWIKRQKFKLSDKIFTHKSSTMDTEANIISISGCFDDQVSYDLGRNGALTTVLLNTLAQKGTNISFSELLQNLRCRLIHMCIKQTPQIMVGKDDLSSEFDTMILKNFLKI